MHRGAGVQRVAGEQRSAWEQLDNRAAAGAEEQSISPSHAMFQMLLQLSDMQQESLL